MEESQPWYNSFALQPADKGAKVAPSKAGPESFRRTGFPFKHKQLIQAYKGKDGKILMKSQSPNLGQNQEEEDLRVERALESYKRQLGKWDRTMLSIEKFRSERMEEDRGTKGTSLSYHLYKLHEKPSMTRTLVDLQNSYQVSSMSKEEL